MGKSEGRALVWLAIVLFSSLCLFFSQTVPVWHEGVSIYPAPATPVLRRSTPQDPGPRLEDGCADPGPIRLLASSVRPQVSVCFRGRQYPLQITSYASGIPYWPTDLLWPIHRGRVFRLRGIALLVGLFMIALTRRMMARFTDAMTASVAALCVAVTPAFLFIHSTLVLYEVLPWLACAAALDQLARCRALVPHAPDRTESPPTARLLAAAALVGLALIADIKAVFLIAPLCLVALRARVRFSAVRLWQWLLIAMLIGAMLLPSLLGNSVNAGAEFSDQVRARLQTFAGQMDPARIVAEAPNLAMFWGDTFAYIALASGDFRPPSLPGVIAILPALLYCFFSAAAYLWRGRGAFVPAACGLMMLTYVGVSALLYEHYPHSNYAPLNAVFGIGMGATIVDGSRWLAARLRWSETFARRAFLALAVGASLWSVIAPGSPTHYANMSINAAVVRKMGAYLTAHPEPEATLFVTTYVLTGVPEAVTGETIRTVKAYNYLDCPPGRNKVGAEPAALEEGRRCLEQRFEALLTAFPGPIRMLVPVKNEPVDHALAADLGPSLEAAANAAHRTFKEEASFAGSNTGPLLRLVRVEAAPPVVPPAATLPERALRAVTLRRKTRVLPHVLETLLLASPHDRRHDRRLARVV